MPLQWEGLTDDVKERLAEVDPELAKTFAAEQIVAAKEAKLAAEKEWLADSRHKLAIAATQQRLARHQQQQHTVTISTQPQPQQRREKKSATTEWTALFLVAFIIVCKILGA